MKHWAAPPDSISLKMNGIKEVFQCFINKNKGIENDRWYIEMIDKESKYFYNKIISKVISNK